MSEISSSSSTLPKSRERYYRPELDGLRYFAFMLVFLCHAVPLRPMTLKSPIANEIIQWLCSIQQAGVAGVDLFFVLSSFLITELLMREFERTKQIDIRSFYIRRALRIWPLYFFFLAFAIWIEGRLFDVEGLSSEFAWGYGLFVGNWSIALAHRPPITAAVVLWSVSIEEQFYIVWPWLMRWLSPRRVGMVAILCIICALATRAFLVAIGSSYLDMYFNTFARLDGIGCGALLAVTLHGRTWQLASRHRAILFFGGCATIVVSIRFLNNTPWEPIGFEHVPLFFCWSVGAVLIFLATLRSPRQSAGVASWKPFVYLGRISYGLYVFHHLAVYLVHLCAGERLSRLGFFMSSSVVVILALLLTILMGTVSYHLIESPFLRWKQRFTHVASRPEGDELVSLSDPLMQRL